MELAGKKPIAQLLESKHHVFGDAAPVVAGFLLPASPSLGLDLGQDGIARMLVSPEHRAVAWRDRGQGLSLGDGSMGSFGVIGTIGGDLRDFAVNLRQQVGEDLAVAPVGGGHLNADDVLLGFIDGQVNLAPGASLAHHVRANFPLALAKYLQPGRIQHHKRATLSRVAGNLHCQSRRPPRHVGEILHRQVQLRKAHQRFQQAFGGAVRQPEQGPERQAGLDRRLRVKPKLASPCRPRRCPALGDALLVKPDRQVTSIDQGTVVFRPVRRSVALFRLARALVHLRARRHQASSLPSKSRRTAKDDNILHQSLFYD
jgi:hypothetical protein